jgi:alpha-L-fucosidase 2
MRHFAILFLAVLVLTSCTGYNNSPKIEGYNLGDNFLTMWYDKPAEDWMTEALPIGNGYMGCMFFGKTGQEQIQFTEGSLWSGGPASNPKYNYGNRDSAFQYLPEIKQLINKGHYDDAYKLCQKELTGTLNYSYDNQCFGDYGAQQTMGDIYIGTTAKIDSCQDYIRGINLNTGRGFVEFTADGVNHKREYYGDYPDKIMVYSYLTTSSISYYIVVCTPHPVESKNFDNNTFNLSGYVADNDMRFCTSLKITSDGKVSYANDTLWIEDAKYFNIYHTAATSYKNEYPSYTGNNPQETCEQVMTSLKDKTQQQISTTQLKDYKELFDRVEIELGDSDSNSPIDKRLAAYKSGIEDAGLEEIYFQYGRYLMISASRIGTLPMNLQGKWNNSTCPPWACDYHFNINEQMLYWPAEITNLSECHVPLLDFVENLVPAGRVSARQNFGTRGWVVSTMCNAFGYTGNGWDVIWGFFPGGASWVSRHLWEHYLYNHDTTYLREHALPVIQEAMMFWVDYLQEDTSGYLISCPSFSPEHGYISAGTTMDHQIATDILSNYIAACEVLNIENALVDTAIYIKSKIYPEHIGRWGQLQEWKEDIDDPADKHRHVSHLYGLYPANSISPFSTPELAETARVSLQARGDEGTGWSLAWKINFYARLQDGDKAYSLLRRLLRPTGDTGYNMADGGGTYNNLLCAHPPFQLDGNMGAIAGIAEMLYNPVHNGPLPALPSSWKNGYIKGLRTQNGNTINIYWQNNKLTKVENY